MVCKHIHNFLLLESMFRICILAQVIVALLSYPMCHDAMNLDFGFVFDLLVIQHSNLHFNEVRTRIPFIKLSLFYYTKKFHT